MRLSLGRVVADAQAVFCRIRGYLDSLEDRLDRLEHQRGLPAEFAVAMRDFEMVKHRVVSLERDRAARRALVADVAMHIADAGLASHLLEGHDEVVP